MLEARLNFGRMFVEYSMKPMSWLFFLTLLSTACLQTRNEKIELAEDLQKQKLERFVLENVKKPPNQMIDEEEAERKRLTIYEKTRVSLQDRRDQERAIEEQLQSVPEDPMASYEIERKRVLDRHWTDVDGLKQE